MRVANFPKRVSGHRALLNILRDYHDAANPIHQHIVIPCDGHHRYRDKAVLDHVVSKMKCCL